MAPMSYSMSFIAYKSHDGSSTMGAVINRGHLMRAEDILANDQNQVERDGIVIRKGSVGAFLASASLWCDPAAEAEQRIAAEGDILAILPALRALGLFEVFSIRDTTLRQLVETHHEPS